MKIITALLVILLSAFASAAEWSDNQSEVWEIVSDSWVDDVGETGEWPSNYVHENVVQWDSEWPVPRGSESLSRWTRFRDSNTEVQEYELFPLAIVIEGDTAVVHYSAVTVRENSEGEDVRTVSGIVEALHRTGGEWKYISLTGFDISSSND